MKLIKSLFILSSAAFLTACPSKDESAADSVEEQVEEVQDEMEDMGEEVQDEVDDAM